MRCFDSSVVCLTLLLICLSTGCGRSEKDSISPLALTLAEANAQLASLPAPDGMSRADFDSLRSAFADQLAGSGKLRWVAAAPADIQNQVRDLALAKIDEFSATASWGYTNVGDYDQNSQVNISDLTPLGSNLGKNSTSSDWATAELADGDANAEVNISDITPLGSHLQTGVDGYYIQATITPETEASWMPVGVAMFADSTQAAPGTRRSFSVVVSAVAGLSYRVVPYFGAENGIPGLPFAYTGQTGPEISFEERQSIFDQITEKMDNLTATTSDGQDAEIAEFIGTLPHIVESGFFEGNAWGRFDDDIPLVVCKNHAPASGQQILSLRGTAAAAAKSASGWGLPDSEEGELLWGYGAGSFYTDPTEELRTIFDETEYLAWDGAASIGTLRNIDGVGFLYLDCPAGSSVNRNSQTEYWIGTVDGASLGNQTLFADDLANNRLGYMWAMDASGSGRWTYCFNSEFVYEYMHFSPNAMVFLNTPMSGSATKLIDEFQFCGAGLVMAWIANVPNDLSYAGSVHLYDRMLGANQLGREENPPIRAFPLQETLFDMQARGVSAGQPIMYPEPPANPWDCLVRFYPLFTPEEGFGLFLPTIEHLEVNIAEDGVGNVLDIFGDFGDTASQVPSVFIGDEYLDYIYRDAKQLTCELPDTGPGAAGDVAVDILSRSSSPRRLTEWRAEITLTAIGPGSLKHKVIYYLHMRADIDGYRQLPDTDPLYFGSAGQGIVPLISAPDSYAEVDSSGVYVDGSAAVTTWTNAADTHASNVYGASLEDFMNMGGSLDMNTLKFTLFMPCQGDHHSKKVNQDATIDHDEDRLFYIELGGAVSVPELFTVVLNDDYSISAGAVSRTQGEVTYQAVWPKITALYPPDDNAKR